MCYVGQLFASLVTLVFLLTFFYTVVAILGDPSSGGSFHDIKVFGKPFEPFLSDAAVDRATSVELCGSGCVFNLELDPKQHENLADQTIAKI